MFDDELTGVRCRSTGYTRYGPFKNKITNYVNYFDLEDEPTKKCNIGEKGFDDERTCWPMTENNKLYPHKVGLLHSFTGSPFFTQDFTLTA